ncbi:hypothetical protein EDC04DRAFT_2578830 [Pisolithus marmoratus]|nr:hypothetical protein EDC04DRAFT_2578830 [Pisolithus marmoratus]
MAHQLDTQAIREFTVNLSNNQQYVFVDTPGFDDGCQSARDILRTIAEWLEKKYRNNVNLTGIIYTHRITDNRMSGSVCENIDMFGRLCGDTATERVRLVTTMWDNVKDAKVAESRVLQLEGNFWKPLIDTGARHEQFKNTSTSAWEIVRGLMPGGREAVLTQEEFVDAERRNETIARDALHTQYQEDLHEQKETMQQIQEEARALNDPELVKQLEAEQRCWEAELRKTSDYDIRELKISFFRRAALLCSRRTETLSVSARHVRSCTLNSCKAAARGPTKSVWQAARNCETRLCHFVSGKILVHIYLPFERLCLNSPVWLAQPGLARAG